MNTLYNKDYKEGLRLIEDKTVDLIITDPPYLHVKGGMSNKKLKGVWDKKSKMVNELSDFGEKEIYDFFENVIPKMKKINMYIFCSKLQLQFYFKYILENKLKYDLLIWDKVNYSMKSSKFYTSDLEYVLRIYENGVSLRKVNIPNTDKIDINYYLKRQSFKKPKNYKHNTEKPLELIERFLLVASEENDLILDPFAGTGTTLEACKKNNRKFIGIEINENYYNICKERLESFDYKLF